MCCQEANCLICSRLGQSSLNSLIQFNIRLGSGCKVRNFNYPCKPRDHTQHETLYPWPACWRCRSSLCLQCSLNSPSPHRNRLKHNITRSQGFMAQLSYLRCIRPSSLPRKVWHPSLAPFYTSTKMGCLGHRGRLGSQITKDGCQGRLQGLPGPRLVKSSRVVF